MPLWDKCLTKGRFSCFESFVFLKAFYGFLFFGSQDCQDFRVYGPSNYHSAKKSCQIPANLVA